MSSKPITFNGFDIRRKIEECGLAGDVATILIFCPCNESSKVVYDLTGIDVKTDENGKITIVLKGE